ncbi:putative galactose oxidase [Helianthus anomalus]
MTLSTSIITHHLIFFLLLLLLHAPPCPASGGSWSILLPSIGISAMHMQLLPNDRVVMFDRTDFGPSQISLPKGKCRHNSTDCTAHSVEYDVASNSIRPLTLRTDIWCSSGALMPNGRLTQTGGWNEGFRVVRNYKPCDKCDWQEIQNGLVQPRWYATNHILPDGRQIIIGGRQTFDYEFYPKMSATENPYSLPFLVQTNDPNVENNLYPFVFLIPDGNLFIFANNRAILFDYSKNQVVRTYPGMPGGQPRNYPSTGSAVLLPLRITNGVVDTVEVMICGGAPKGAFTNALNGKFDRALDTCGRIKISDEYPKWFMETMPLARVVGDMLLLPNGHVLLINGASAGSAGWELGRNPVLNPVVYDPEDPVGSRFKVQNPSTKPRVYHSTAVLLRDGRVLVGGSNPHDKYVFTDIIYPTELSLEAFSPSYLDSSLVTLRPNIILPKTNSKIRYGKGLAIRFTVSGPVNLNLVSVTMISPSFNTHSFSMNQRLLVLDSSNSTKSVGQSYYTVDVIAPPSGNIAPAGYYLLFVVHKEIPSPGVWVRIQ